MKFAHLVKVNTDGHNIEYRMTEEGCIFHIEISRIGSVPVCSKRPMALWDSTYDRKIREGYVDRTEFCLVSEGEPHRPISNREVEDLWNLLNRYSNEVIEENYSISISEVSDWMINEAGRLIGCLSLQTDTGAFNEILGRLFIVMPRKMHNVSEMLAKSRAEFPVIIDRENDLLEVMKAQVAARNAAADRSGTILDVMHLRIRPCTVHETESIKQHLHPGTVPLFKRAFRVRNLDTEDRFREFYERNGYLKKNIHYYYHGSRNENWLGIITAGLKLSPQKAIKNGSMFGPNIYTAPKSDKSEKYTSLKGSFWAHGDSDRGFIAVYKTLYKNARHIATWDPSLSLISKENIAPYDALYCHGGPGLTLRNDECVLPYEEQVTIQYLIELNI